MKTMLLAVTAVFSLGVGAAFAESEGGPAANTRFTEMRGVVAEAPAQHAPAAAMAQNGPSVQAYATQTGGGAWLFAPNGNEGANN